MSWLATHFRKRTSSRRSSLSLLLAALALWIQIVAGSVAMPHAMPDGLDDAISASICHADPSAANTPAAPRPDHTPDCALCPVCQIAAQAQLVLPPLAPVLAAPYAIARTEFAITPAPALTQNAASPSRARGPPITA